MKHETTAHPHEKLTPGEVIRSGWVLSLPRLRDMLSRQLQLHLRALPLDLAVSKIARRADNDKEDIAALVRLGLTTSSDIEQRATSALGGYVGGQAMLRLNIRDAVALARQVEELRDAQ